MSCDLGNPIFEQVRPMCREMASIRTEKASLLANMNAHLRSADLAVSGIAYILVETRGERLGHAERIERLEQART